MQHSTRANDEGLSKMDGFLVMHKYSVIYILSSWMVSLEYPAIISSPDQIT